VKTADTISGTVPIIPSRRQMTLTPEIRAQVARDPDLRGTYIDRRARDILLVAMIAQGRPEDDFSHDEYATAAQAAADELDGKPHEVRLG
jgi:hypothetical protein